MDGILQPAGIDGTAQGPLSGGGQRPSGPGVPMAALSGKLAADRLMADMASTAGPARWLSLVVCRRDQRLRALRLLGDRLRRLGLLALLSLGRTPEPDNHIAFNVALYQPSGDLWTMTERGRALTCPGAPTACRSGRAACALTAPACGSISMRRRCPGPAASLAEGVAGSITLRPSFLTADSVDLDPAGRHRWWPVAPLARVSVDCDAFPGGGWEGQAYHDINSATADRNRFLGWDWARGHGGRESAGADGPWFLYDSLMRMARAGRWDSALMPMVP